MNNQQAVRHEGFKSLSLILNQLDDRSGIAKKMLSSMGKSSSLWIILSSFTDTTAADSSKREIVIAFKGARRDFPMKSEQ